MKSNQEVRKELLAMEKQDQQTLQELVEERRKELGLEPLSQVTKALQERHNETKRNSEKTPCRSDDLSRPTISKTKKPNK